jgi:diaminohydroxyphosphoribosylaminopyrimidine deaminase/5-amino-6-(5-phosphoribosylamino)uracil reductase
VLVVTAAAPPERATALRAAGCEVLAVAAESGRVALAPLLDELGRRRFTNVLVEGGSEVLGSFLGAAAVDEVHVFIAPRLAGGAAARTPFGGRGADRIADALRLDRWETESIDGDLYVHGWL